MPIEKHSQRKDAGHSKGSGPRFEELESRLLLSADFIAGIDVASPIEPAIIQQIDQTPAADASASVEAAAQSRKELVLIDPRIKGYDTMLSDLLGADHPGRDLDVLVLDPSRDGVQQVSEALAGRTDISAIHVLSHGSDGAFNLGGTQLNFDSMLANASAIRQWGQALTADADVLLYGCDLAASADGRSLIDALSGLTGADVAASVDATGSAVLGGDWQLEYHTGSVESQIAPSNAAQAQWDYLLAAPVINSDGGGASASVSVTENTSAVTTVQATDSDLDTLTYSIVGGADAAQFSINASTGALRFSVARNFEFPTDAGANNVYNVTVQVSDGNGGTDTQAIAVTLTDVNEAPSGGGAHNYFENFETYGNLSSGSAISQAGEWFALAPNVFEVQNEGIYLGNGVTTNKVLEVEGGGGGTTVYRDFATSTGETFVLEMLYSPRNGSLASSAVEVYWEGVSVGTLNAGVVGMQTYTFNLTATSGSGTSRLSFVALDNSGAGGVIDNINLQGSGISSATVTATEDVGYAFTVADFQFNDPDAGDSLSAVRIDSLPVAGTLRLSGVAVIAGDVISAANITAGNLVFTPAPEASGSPYASFTFSVCDQSATYDPTPNPMRINVTSTNDAPVITSNGGAATAAVSIAENTTAVTTVTATDADVPAQTLTYTIAGGADAALFTIGSSSGVLSFSAARNFETPADAGANNVYNVTIQVADGNGGTDTQAISVTITDVNEGSPSITSNGGGANASISVAENTTAVTTVTATDVDMLQTLAYSISGGADAALFTIDSSTGALSFLTARNFEAPTDVGANNIYDVTVQVSDGNGGTDTQAVAVTVTDANEAPVITSNGGGANASISVAENTTAVTTVAASDVDGAQTMTYSIAGGADAALFAIDSSTGALSFLAARNFEAPADVGANNIYDVTVQVSDGNGGIDTQAVAVTVTNVNDAPAITSNGGGVTASVSAAENTTAVTTVVASDADVPAQTFTYSISGGADAALFTIDSSTGVLTFLAARNFEAPADVGANNIYDVTVQVSDGNGGTDTQAIAVTVTNVNEAPTGTNVTMTINEDASHTFTAANFGFSDVDVGDSLGAVRIDTLPAAGTLTLSGLPVNAGDVVSVANIVAGNLLFTPATNANGSAYASFTFSVFDQSALADAAPNTATFNVTPTNDAPAITSNGGGANASVSVAENTTAVTTVSATDIDVPADMLAYTIVGGADAAFFSVDVSSGALTFVAGPDFDVPADADLNNIYEVTVQVADGNGGFDTQAISVTVTNANEAPIITSNGGGATASVSIAENGTAVATVSATDADVPAQTLTYSIAGGADAALFTVDSSTGALSFLAARNFEAPADVGANNIYDVTVQVSDGNGGFDTQAIAVTVTNVNEAPIVTSNSGGANASVFVAENTTSVTTVVATDVDTAQTMTYSISGGADSALFTIDSSTGVLSFSVAPNVEAPADAGADNIYDVTVQVSDGNGGFDTQVISVTVADVNETPVITSNGGGATASVSIAENGTAVAIVSATDVDVPAQTLTYSIAGGADAALFAIDSSTGALSFLAARNFEAPADVGANNIYDVTVQVSDGNGGIDTQAIAVTVTNVNEAPTIVSNGAGATASVSVAENTTAVTTVVATDVDAAQVLAYAIVGGADAAFFAIDSSTGALSFLAARNFEAPADAGLNNIYDVTVQVSDGNGGTDTQAISVTVADANEVPVITSNGGGANASVSTSENTTAVTTVGATDVDIAQTLTYSIAGGADAAFFAIDASSGVLTFLLAPDFEAPADAGANNIYDVIVQASDGNGGTDTQTISVTVVNGSEAPAGTDTLVATTEDVSYVLTVADFGFTDPDVGDSLSAVRIDTVPASGTLRLLGATVNAGDVISAASIAAGDLVFTPAPDASGSPYANFTFSVRDQSAVYDAAPNTLTVDVTAANDAPVVSTNSGLTLTGGASVTVSAAELSAVDLDNTAAQLVYTVTSVPTAGVLMLNGVALNVNDTFTQADLNANRVTYQHTNGSATSDTFGFTVADGAGGNAGPGSFAITATLVVPPPGPTPPPVTPPGSGPVAPPPTVNPAVPPPVVTDTDSPDEIPYVSSQPGLSAPKPIVPPTGSVPTTMLAKLVFDEAPITTNTAGFVDIAKTRVVSAAESFKALGQALDELRRNMNEEGTSLTVRASMSGGAVLTVGFVAWLLRSGALVSSLMATAPLWNRFDPVPILAGRRRSDDERDADIKERVSVSRDRRERALRKLFQIGAGTPSRRRS